MIRFIYRFRLSILMGKSSAVKTKRTSEKKETKQVESTVESPSEPVKTFNVSRKLGKNLPGIIAGMHYKGTIPGIKQLHHNSWDANAHRIDITYRSNYFSLGDDGLGIFPDDVPQFVLLGDSEKEKERFSPAPECRERYGIMGLGTINLTKLGRKWKMTSERGGFKSVVEENLEGKRLTSDEELEVLVYDTPKERHGTLIELTDLTFDKEFSIEQLIKRLQWEVRILPDFKTFVNGQEINSKSVENATTYSFDENGGIMGKVSGKVYFTSRTTPNNGIHVYVNGRSIGDPLERLSRLTPKRGMDSRLVGIINADELRGAIMLGTETFVEGDAGVKELDKALKRFLQSVRTDTEQTTVGVRAENLLNDRQAVAEHARGELARAGFPEVRENGSVIFAEPGEKNDGDFIAYDTKNKVYILNPDYPPFAVDSNTLFREHCLSALHLLIDAIAITRLERGKQNLKDFFKMRDNLWAAYRGQEDPTIGKEILTRINPIRMYSALDLSNKGSMDISGHSIRKCVDHGILRSDGNIKGEEFLRFQSNYECFVTLHDVLGRQELGSNQTVQFDRANGILGDIGDLTSPFAYNVSRLDDKENPFYFLDETTSQLIWNTISEINLKRDSPREEFSKFRGRHLTVGGLGDLLGTHRNLLPEILEFGRDHDLYNIRMKKSGVKGGNDDETGHVFHLGDFVRAYQLLRGCDWIKEEKYLWS
jgi:hypothetical protein